MDAPGSDTPLCEVIGCDSHAQWFLITERAGLMVEQFLCHAHWRQTLADKSHRVIRWTRASAAERVSASPAAAGAEEDLPAQPLS